jgi:hypothetical protein
MMCLIPTLIPTKEDDAATDEQKSGQGTNSPKVITNLYTIVFTEISIFEQMTFMYLSLLSCNCK